LPCQVFRHVEAQGALEDQVPALHHQLGEGAGQGTGDLVVAADLSAEFGRQEEDALVVPPLPLHVGARAQPHAASVVKGGAPAGAGHRVARGLQGRRHLGEDGRAVGVAVVAVEGEGELVAVERQLGAEGRFLVVRAAKLARAVDGAP
jgi:hypothetical protein